MFALQLSVRFFAVVCMPDIIIFKLHGPGDFRMSMPEQMYNFLIKLFYRALNKYNISIFLYPFAI